MTRRASFLCFMAFAAWLPGCSSITYPPASGTWAFSLVSQIKPSEIPQSLTGTVTAKDADISASLVFSNSCFDGEKIAFTGTIDSTGDAKLFSTTYKNQNIYLSGTLSPDGSYLTSGTYTVTPEDNTQAACAGSDSGTSSGKRTAPATAAPAAASNAAH